MFPEFPVVMAIFPVTMRGVPTVTAYNPATGASNSVLRDTVSVTPIIQNAGNSSVSIRAPSGASVTTLNFHYTVSAEL